jgi:hypothetical protein
LRRAAGALAPRHRGRLFAERVHMALGRCAMVRLRLATLIAFLIFRLDGRLM